MALRILATNMLLIFLVSSVLGATISILGTSSSTNIINIVNISTNTSSGGGGGVNVTGLDSATANKTYLKLDTSNDPLTGTLTINGSSVNTNWIEMRNSSGGTPLALVYDLLGLGQYNTWICAGMTCGFISNDLLGGMLFNPQSKLIYLVGSTQISGGAQIDSATIDSLFLGGNALGSGWNFTGLENLNINKLNNQTQFRCGTNQSLQYWNINGSSGCVSVNASSGGSTTNNFYTFYTYNNTPVTTNVTFIDNWTWYGESGWSGTAVAFNTLSFVPFGTSPNSVSTSFTVRASNVSEGMAIKNLRVNRGSSAPSFNVSLYRDGTDTGFGCRVAPNTAYAECQNTSTYWMNPNRRYAWGILADNATTITGISITYALDRNVSRNISMTINVSAPFTPFTRTTNCVALDTVYQNNRSVPISVEGSILSAVKSTGDSAFVSATVGANPPATYIQGFGVKYNEVIALTAYSQKLPFSFSVAPYQNYSLVSTLSGSGALSLEYCNEVTR